jgi:RNA methyltransferase, TrmH family
VGATSAAVARARQLLSRKGRDSSGNFLAEGPATIASGLESGALVALYVTRSARDRFGELVAAAQSRAAEVFEVEDRVLKTLGETVAPQGIVAVFRQPLSNLEQLDSSTRLVVVLVGAQDPGNVGSVIRVADAVGAAAVVLTSNSVDPFNLKVVRSTTGSIFHVPVISGVEVDEALRACARVGLMTVAATGDGAAELFMPDVDARLANPTAWVFGNEASGLPEPVIAACDLSVRVPIVGRAESLNLSVAAGVCLYASLAAQRPASATGPSDRSVPSTRG